MNNYALPIRFGVAASGCLIAYFLILSLLGLHTNVFYSLFNTIYSTELQPGFLEELSTRWANTYRSFEAIVFLVVATMGFTTSLVLTLSFMQLFKSSNTTKNKRN